MKLDIRMFNTNPGTNESACFKVIGCSPAFFAHHPFQQHPCLFVELECGIKRNRLFATVLDIHLEVILQILADTRQINNDRHLDLLKVNRPPDSGQLQQLCGVDHTAAQNDFPCATYGTDSIAGNNFNASYPGPVKYQARGQRSFHDR